MFIDRIRVKFLWQSLIEIKGFARIFQRVGVGCSYESPHVILNLVYTAGLPCVSAGSYLCDNKWVSSTGKDACRADSLDMCVFTYWIISFPCCWLQNKSSHLSHGGKDLRRYSERNPWKSNFTSRSKAPKAVWLELFLHSGLEVASDLDLT